LGVKRRKEITRRLGEKEEGGDMTEALKIQTQLLPQPDLNLFSARKLNLVRFQASSTNRTNVGFSQITGK
jgi:hypothetical protein